MIGGFFRRGVLFNKTPKRKKGCREDGNIAARDAEIAVEVSVGPKGVIEDLDVKIAGGRDAPYIAENPGLFVIHVRPGSDAEKCLSPGTQITKIGGVDVTNVPSYVAQNLFRCADERVKIHARTSNTNTVSGSSSKLISWGTVSLETLDNNTDSSRGSDLSEKESKVNATSERVDVTIPVGNRGELLPLDFEIYGGQDEPSIEGNPGIFIKELKIGSEMEKKVKVGDQILKVNGDCTTEVPKHIFFNLLRGADKVAKIQILRQEDSKWQKGETKIQVFEDEETAEDEIIVEISTGPTGRLGQLGFKINGGRDKPCVPGDPGIFIKEIKRGSVVEKTLGPGDKILKIDGANVTNVPFRFALEKIKRADRRVRLHIKKADAEQTQHDNSVSTRRKTAWKAVNSFSEEQLGEFQTAFAVYDRSMKGRISLKSAIHLCRSLGYNLTIHDIDLIITDFTLSGSLSGDSKITFLDLIQIINKIATANRSESDLYEAYEVFDREEKGFFDIQEFKEAIKEMPGSEEIPDGDIEEMLDLADPDGDGKIKYHEFRDLVLPVFHQY